MSIPTPHIRAKEGDFASTVLMPGDPLRAKFIADNYLEKAELVTDVRNMYGFTGYYHDKRISVMGSGMGMPSIGIYSHELYSFYGVESIIRIGSAGAISDSCHVMDIVIAEGACTNSAWSAQFDIMGGSFAPIASWELLLKAVETAKAQGTKVLVGNVLSEDQFYHDRPDFIDGWKKLGVLCAEMETAALYMEAARSGKQALGIFTISDEIYTGRALDAEARQTSFRKMMELALEL